MKIHFSYIRSLIFFVLCSALLPGCFEEKTLATGPTLTVEWFKEHNKERKEVLKECSNNPGEMKILPNCQNAKRAELILSSGELKPMDFNWKSSDLPERPWRK